MSKRDDSLGFSTRAIHAGWEHTQGQGAVSPPIFQTSTFAFHNSLHGEELFLGKEEGYIYTRMGNPTVRALEECIANLEGGYQGIATASGMGAVTTVYMTYLGQGKHVVASSSMYGPSRMVLERDFQRFGVEATFVETADFDAVQEAIRPNTSLVFVETPTNPTLAITDLRAVGDLCQKRGIVSVVDNTFMSPKLQRPLDFGVDVVLHSLTKYLNGHSDVVGGVLVPRNQEHYDALRKVMYYMGPCIDPHPAWLVLRGIRTLPLRIERAEENARRLARYLDGHPKLEWICYPGLPSHPQHQLAQEQMDGFGSMISIELKGGIEAGRVLLDHAKLFTLAVSLGGLESLIQHPATMTHANIPLDERLEAGITNGLVRLSVGCEDCEDLEKDLEQALAQIPSP